jgi:GTP-sensing pleiotropic transcriptional regulator CodY
MGEMKRANAYEEERRVKDRFASTLCISASIIAAVRLARDDISRPSPRLASVIADSVGLARMILEKVMR